MVKFLTIESTCDETAAAVVTDELEVLSSVIASQDELHARFRGVVPEIAARAHVQRILPVIDQALQNARTPLDQIDAVAVATTPGLAGSLLVGLIAAKCICFARQIPLIAINHLHAHIYACRLSSGRDVFPCVGFVISGGHTHLYRCATPLEFEFLGGTIDDAVGEAFDKVASMLGLGYPGGPAISRVASEGNPEAFSFPRTFIHEQQRLQFSFSGLKTAVRYQVAGPGQVDWSKIKLEAQTVADLAASFEQAAVDCLVAKAVAAVQQTGLRTLCVGGGVAANRRLREQLSARMRELGISLHIAPPQLCTDNAVMGAIAREYYRAGKFQSLDADIAAGLVRW